MNEEEVFHEALARNLAHERAAYLEKACADNALLRTSVEALLRANVGASGFLNYPVSALAATADEPAATERPGAVIGPYKLLQQIGEGGFGTVFMAEQSQPVQRKVALKVIKAGMDSRQVIARFEAERQALAMMDHVNIARVLDAGTTEAGLPYFVMELVHGVPITKYCDDNRLTPRQRLELFVPVCQAIQHAHQKGIIHRDIKPTNVMITLYDGKPVPKVIDFGVAKATEQRLTERTLFTQYGAMIGTLEYMSPEQAEMSALGADTRSDIFSLGVLLYELLTGSTPLSRKRVTGAAYGEVLRMIQEEEPPKPSKRLSELGRSGDSSLAGPATGSARLAGPTTSLASVAALRHTEPTKLMKLVRGELDWIVMKALEKDRNRRYETASTFAADVQRYLNDEPVLACPPSFWYRFRKLARRYKRTFAVASALVLLLLAGTAISSYFAIQALTRAKEAEHNAHLAKANEEAADQQRQKAQENLGDARAAVDQMLTRVADRLAPVPQMEHVRRELFEDALKFYQKFLGKNGHDPVLREETAWVYRRLAVIQRSLGRLVEAEQSYRKHFAMFEELEAQSPLEPSTRAALVRAHIQFAGLRFELGSHEDREEHLHRAVRMAEDLVKEFPNDQVYRDQLVNANYHLITDVRRPPDQEEEMLRRNLKLTENPHLVGNIYFLLANLKLRQGRYAEAEKDYLKSFETFETIAARYEMGSALLHMAEAVAADGRGEKADALYRRAAAIVDKLATDHPGYYHFRKNQALMHYQQGNVLKKLNRTADAEQAYRRAADLYEKLAADFPTFPAYQQSAFDQRLELGRFLVEAGRLQDAQQVYSEAMALAGKLTADFPTRLKHWQGLVRSHIELGQLLERCGKMPEADKAIGQALAISERLEAEHGGKPDYRREVARSHCGAARLLRLDSRYSEAEKLYRWALEHYARLASESSQAEQTREDLAFAHFELADHYRWAPGRLKDSEKVFRQALEQYEKLSGDFPTVPRYRILTADCRERLASVLLFQGRLPEADQGFKEALVLSERLAEEHPADPAVRIALALGSRHWGEALRGMARTPEAEKAFRRSLPILGKLIADFPTESWYRIELGVTCQMLGALLARDLKQLQAAEEYYHRGVGIFEKLIAEFPRDPSYRVRLADAHREWAFCLRDIGRAQEATAIFDLAIANFSKAIELGSRDIWGVWYPLALVHLSTGRTKEYRALCETLLERFGQSHDPDLWVVIICRQAPDAVADPAQPVQIAEKLLAREPRNADFIGLLGVTLYRKGDLNAAVQRLEASIRGAPGVGVHWRKLFLAMAYHRLDRTAEAQQLLKETTQWIEKNAQEKLGEEAQLSAPLPWCRRLDLQLLRRETEELLRKNGGP